MSFNSHVSNPRVDDLNQMSNWERVGVEDEKRYRESRPMAIKLFEVTNLRI